MVTLKYMMLVLVEVEDGKPEDLMYIVLMESMTVDVVRPAYSS